MKTVFHRSIISGVLLCGLLGSGLALSQTISEVAQGIHGDFYYVLFKDSGNARITLHEDGRYSAEWNQSTNNWFGGLGWNPGGDRVVHYSGEFKPAADSIAYLSMYGWMSDSKIEYYIVESYSGVNPGQLAPREFFGAYESDGSFYDVYRYRRTQGIAINSPVLTTYYSVRRQPKSPGMVEGTITTRHHFDAWADVGLEMGTHNYMILATEGYQGSGTSDITVSSENSPDPHPDSGKAGALALPFWILIVNLLMALRFCRHCCNRH